MILAYTPLVLFCLSGNLSVTPRVQRIIEATVNMTYSSYLIHFPIQLLIAVGFAMSATPFRLRSDLFCGLRHSHPAGLAIDLSLFRGAGPSFSSLPPVAAVGHGDDACVRGDKSNMPAKRIRSGCGSVSVDVAASSYPQSRLVAFNCTLALRISCIILRFSYPLDTPALLSLSGHCPDTFALGAPEHDLTLLPARPGRK